MGPPCKRCGLRRLDVDAQSRPRNQHDRRQQAAWCRCLAPGVRSARATLATLDAFGLREQRRALALALARGDVDAVRAALSEATTALTRGAA